jgi:BirA family transcriptional regulator, biotin operon repressor / biotin---[acetyl-CoA-carboxylase] ligase
MSDAFADAPSLPSFYRLVRHCRIASTNDEAKRLARMGEGEGTLVWARAQSAGHGRQGRVWVSPPGNLYLSLILRPEVPLAAAAQLGFAGALAVGEACRELAPGAAISFKWPNDVLLAGRKMSGLLLESEAQRGSDLAWLVLGIGVNLATYPVAADYPATALAATGVEITPGVLLGALARRFLAWYEQWRATGFAALRDAWLAQAQGMGREIRVRLPQESFTGIFAGLDADGALLLDGGAGRRRVAAGEVFPAAAAS